MTTLQEIVRRVVARGESERPFFVSFIIEIESHFGRKVSSMREMKVRDNRRLKGNLWEEFCQAYLISLDRYENVWLWPQIPDSTREKLGLTSRLDNGIDIICETKKRKDGTSSHIAVQCKYRKKIDGRVPWNTLATFVGMTAVTGPYMRHLVMTNCKGVSRKVKMPKKDWSICYGTFRSLKREYWLKMAGDYVEHRLSDSLEIFSSAGAAVVEEKKVDEIDVEKLRLLRLKRFEKN